MKKIVSVIIVLILIIVFVFFKLGINDDNNKINKDTNISKKEVGINSQTNLIVQKGNDVYYMTRKGINHLNIKTRKKELIVNDKGFCSEMYLDGQKLFCHYINSKTHKHGIYVYDLNTNNSEIIYTVDFVEMVLYKQYIFLKTEYYIGRINKDGSDYKSLFSAFVDGWALYNNKIYFNDRYNCKLYRANLDTTEMEVLYDKEIDSFELYNNNIYFSSDAKCYSMNIDGKNITKLNEEVYYGYFINRYFFEDNLYCSEGGEIYKINILTNSYEHIYSVKGNISDFGITQDALYIEYFTGPWYKEKFHNKIVVLNDIIESKSYTS